MGRVSTFCLFSVLGLLAVGAPATAQFGVPELIKDISSSTFNSLPQQLFYDATLGVVFFAADDGVNGNELWMSDGTEIGTVLAKDLVPGEDDSNPYEFVSVGGTTLFYTSLSSPSLLRKLWKTDGTSEGTVAISPNPVGNPSVILPGAVSGGTLFFGLGSELWISDGTEVGTVAVRDLGGCCLRNVTDLNGTAFFYGNDAVNGTELWTSDGSFVGTSMVTDLNSGSFSGAYNDMVALDNFVVFAGNDGVFGRELYRSDGTEMGTVRIKDIYNSAAGSDPRDSVVVDGKVYFSADSNFNDTALWVSDGTEGGTMLLTSAGGASKANNFVSYNGNIFFALYSSGANAIWETNGTPAGTKLFKAANQFFGATVVGSTLFFLGNDAANGSELWSSDGTVQSQDIYPGRADPASNSPENFLKH